MSHAGETLSSYVPPAVLATAANLNRGWVTKASELGLVNTSALDGEDLIVVRVFALVDQLVWPGERRSRSVSRGMEPWQSLAVNAARDAARDPSTTLETVLWIMPDGVSVTHTHGEHAEFIVDASSGRCIFGIPLGEWIAELPPRLETIFSWPRQLMSSTINLTDGAQAQLAAFSTILQQLTVFAAIPTPSKLDTDALTSIKDHVLALHPESSLRIVERQVDGSETTDKSQWHEIYERPGGGLIKRPLAFKALLSEYGPQLKQFGVNQDSARRKANT